VKGPDEATTEDTTGGANESPKKPKKKPEFVQFPDSPIYQIRSLCHKCATPNAAHTCSKCFGVRYCGPTCQKNDWKDSHKEECPGICARIQEITANLNSDAAQAAGAPSGDAAIEEVLWGRVRVRVRVRVVTQPSKRFFASLDNNTANKKKLPLFHNPCCLLEARKYVVAEAERFKEIGRYREAYVDELVSNGETRGEEVAHQKTHDMALNLTLTLNSNPNP